MNTSSVYFQKKNRVHKGLKGGSYHQYLLKSPWQRILRVEKESFFQLRRQINKEVLNGVRKPQELLKQLDRVWPKNIRQVERDILKRQLELNVGLGEVYSQEMTVDQLQQIFTKSETISQNTLPKLHVLIIGASIAGLRFANALYDKYTNLMKHEKTYELHIHLFERNFIESRNQLIMLENFWLKRTLKRENGEPRNFGAFYNILQLRSFSTILPKKKHEDFDVFSFLHEKKITWNDPGFILSDVVKEKKWSPAQRPVMPIDLLVLSEKKKWKEKKQKIHVCKLSAAVIESLVEWANKQEKKLKVALVGADGERSIVAQKGGFGMSINNNAPAFAYGCTFTWYIPRKQRVKLINSNEATRGGPQSRYRVFSFRVKSEQEMEYLEQNNIKRAQEVESLGWIFYVGVQVSLQEFQKIKTEFQDVPSRLFKDFKLEEDKANTNVTLSARTILQDACRLTNCPIEDDSLISVSTFQTYGPHRRSFLSQTPLPGRVYVAPFIKTQRKVISLLLGDAFFGSNFFSGMGVNLAIQRSVELAEILPPHIFKLYMENVENLTGDFSEQYKKNYKHLTPQNLRSFHTSRRFTWEPPTSQGLLNVGKILQKEFVKEKWPLLCPERLKIRIFKNGKLNIHLKTFNSLVRDWCCPELYSSEGLNGKNQFFESLLPFDIKDTNLLNSIRRAFTNDIKNNPEDFYRYNFRSNLFPIQNKNNINAVITLSIIPCTEESFVDGWKYAGHQLEPKCKFENFNFQKYEFHKYSASEELLFAIPVSKFNRGYTEGDEDYNEFSLPLIEQSIEELKRLLSYFGIKKQLFPPRINIEALKPEKCGIGELVFEFIRDELQKIGSFTRN